VPYTYDADGNTLSKTNNGGATTYTWDFENRLTSVTQPSGSVTSFVYDPFGRRIQKTAPSGTTTYVYDGDNIIEELTGTTGTMSERYTYGPGIDEPLVGQRQPKIFYYEADGLGSVTSLTDPTGAVAATYSYDSFGFMTASTGSATNWFRYTARQFDSDTGLYYYRARYYDPAAGRFLSEDPTHFSAGVNFYSYVENQPMDLADPFGLCPQQAQDQKKNEAVGLGKITLGIGLLLTLPEGDIPGGVAGAVLLTSANLGALTTTASGLLDVTSAATNKDYSQAQEILDANRNVAGVVVTPIGGINSGQTAATAMDVITLAADPKSAAKNAFTALDAVNTIINAVSSAQQSSAFQTFVGVVTNFFSSSNHGPLI
jgi:RHS repeat-associated protein